MRLEAIETRIDEFDERNLVLQAALGFASAAGTVDRVFARHVPEEAALRQGELQPEDALLVDFALGVLSFRRTIGRILSSVSAASVDSKNLPASEETWTPHGVLR